MLKRNLVEERGKILKERKTKRKEICLASSFPFPTSSGPPVAHRTESKLIGVAPRHQGWAPAFDLFIPVFVHQQQLARPLCPFRTADQSRMTSPCHANWSCFCNCPVSPSKAGTDLLVFGFPAGCASLWGHSRCSTSLVEWKDE